MSTDDLKLKIEEWLAPVLSEKNLFLVDMKAPMGKKLEVYIDSDEGIHIEDCAFISRFLEGHLDGSGLVPDNYILEVSSPGMSNPLKVPRQYKKRIGRMLEVLKTDGQLIQAQLFEVNDEKIKLREVIEAKKKNKKNAEKPRQPNEYEVSYKDIKRATLVF